MPVALTSRRWLAVDVVLHVGVFVVGVGGACLSMWIAALIFPALFFYPVFGALSVLFFLNSLTAARIVLSVWCREPGPRLWLVILAVPNIWGDVRFGRDSDLRELEVAVYLFLATAVIGGLADLLRATGATEVEV